MGSREMRPRRTPRLTRRALLQAAWLAAAGAVAAGCQASGQSPGARGEPTPGAATKAPLTAGTRPAASLALAPRQKLTVAWTAITGSQAGLYTAYESGAWTELGLDVDLVRISSSSQLAAALRAGELDGGVLDWALAFQFQAQGGNAREVAAIVNRLIQSVITIPDIHTPQELVGKRWGITRLGSANHTASLVALEMWGLRPSDVQFLAVQDAPSILAAMQAGQIDVGTMPPPTNTRAIQAGFSELVDLAANGPEYPSVGLAILDRHIQENPALVRAYVAGYAMGVARFRQDRSQALQVLRKYLQIDDEATLAETYEQSARYLAYPPTLPLTSLERIKEDVTQNDPAVANVAITDVADARFVDELQAQGFFEALP